MCISQRKTVFFDHFFFYPKIECENKSYGTATLETLLVKTKQSQKKKKTETQKQKQNQNQERNIKKRDNIDQSLI